MIQVFGGTRLSARVIETLQPEGIDVSVSVTRESARRMYPTLDPSRIHVGRLTAPQVEAFLRERPVRAVVDATHPFATTISRNAIRSCRVLGCPYVFVERPRVLPDRDTQLLRVSTWERAVQETASVRRALLAVGVRELERFVPLQHSLELYVRVLPRQDSLGKALEAGFEPSRIMALWPPVPARLERALLDAYDMELLVTKESGADGGLPQKWEAVQASNARLLVIERPDITYPHRVKRLSALTEWVKNRALPA